MQSDSFSPFLSAFVTNIPFLSCRLGAMVYIRRLRDFVTGHLYGVMPADGRKQQATMAGRAPVSSYRLSFI